MKQSLYVKNHCVNSDDCIRTSLRFIKLSHVETFNENTGTVTSLVELENPGEIFRKQILSRIISSLENAAMK